MIKSNITDNESAKMKTSKGVIQGYVGVASVDKRHQVIVGAEAFGQGQEHDLLIPMIEGIRENFTRIGCKGDALATAQLTADSGYHSEKNMGYVFTKQIDGYIADTNFRERDPRFVAYDRFKDRYRRELHKSRGGRKLFVPADFVFAVDFSSWLCPAGKKLYRSGGNVRVKNYRAIKFRGAKSSCMPCKLRRECLRYPDKTETRQVVYLTEKDANGQLRFTERMKRKIDTAIGRTIYGMRLAVGDLPLPIFDLFSVWINSHYEANGKSTASGTCSVSFITCKRFIVTEWPSRREKKRDTMGPKHQYRNGTMT